MATLADKFDWPHHVAATRCLLAMTIVDKIVLTVGAAYTVGVLAESPVGVSVWQILFALMSKYIVHPLTDPLAADVNRGLLHLTKLKDYIVGNA